MRAFLAATLVPALAPLALHGQSPDVRVPVEVRVRAEAERPAATDTGDVFSLLRARLGVEATIAPGALVFVQVQDARTFGEELSTTEGSADRLDVHQAWLQYGSRVGTYTWAVRAGRQEISVGNERLVGTVGWSNTGRSFDAARLTFGRERAAWNVSAFAAIVQERGRRLTEVAGEDDHLLLGAFIDGTPVELFALHDRKAAYRVWNDVDRTTLGARAVTPPAGGLAATFEAVYQLGTQTGLFDDIIMPQDIRAWLLAARIGYATPLALLPQLGLGIDVLSGDESASDGVYSAFNTLYATNHRFYGYIDFFLDPAARTRDRGLIDGMASASLRIQRAQLDVDVHGFWLQQELSVNSGRQLGWELDVTVPVRLGAGQQLQLGYSAFRNGPAAEVTGLGREQEWSHWGYLQATFSFGGGPPPLR